MKYKMRTHIETYSTGIHQVPGRNAYEVNFHFSQHAVDVGAQLDQVSPPVGDLRFRCPDIHGQIDQDYTLFIPPGKVAVIVIWTYINITA